MQAGSDYPVLHGGSEGESRQEVKRLVIREWDRQWCGEDTMKKSLFGRGAS